MPKITKQNKPQKKTSAAPKRKKARKQRTRLERALQIVGSVLIVVIISSTLYQLLGKKDGVSNVPINAIGSALTPVQEFVTEKVSVVKSFFTTWHDYKALQAQNEELVRQNTQLTLELNSADEAVRENERLLSVVQARQTYSNLNPVFARIIARDAGQWFTTFTLNCGTNQGISADMAVVNEDGLIGRVYEVGSNYAKVITIIDSRSGLSCLVQRTRDNGIMRGGITGSADEAKCYIYYLPNLNNIIPGDTVITSGTDSLFPKGLVVGTITELSLDAGSEGNYAVLAPAVDFLHLEEVVVLCTKAEKPMEENLPTLPTASPAPSPSPSPTPDPRFAQTPDPNNEDLNWQYPTGDDGQEVEPLIEMLPEDAWIDA